MLGEAGRPAVQGPSMNRAKQQAATALGYPAGTGTATDTALPAHETATQSMTFEVLGATIIKVCAWPSAVAVPPAVSGTQMMSSRAEATQHYS